MLFKVSFDKQIHILKSINIKNLQELKASIPRVFKAYPSKFYLCYLDEDGDQITLASEADFNILLKTELRSIKIIIKEKSEQFYDQTQKIEIQIQALIENDSQLNEASVIHHSDINNKSLDESIDEKLKSILPEIMSKIKREITEELLSNSKSSQLRTDYSKTSNKKKQIPKVVHKGYTCDGCSKDDIEGIRYKCAVCADFDFCQSCESKIDHAHPFLKIRQLSKAPFKISVVLKDSENSSFSNLVDQGINFTQQFLKQFTQNVSELKVQTKLSQPKQQQKTEIKVQPKVEVKVQPKIQIKPQEKIEPKIQTQQERSINLKDSSKPVESKEEKKEKEQRIIENANYLTNILELNFTKCYTFANKNENLSKQQLLEKYINERPF